MVEIPKQLGSKRRWVQTVTEPIEGNLCWRRACFLSERPVNSRIRVLEEPLVSPHTERRERHYYEGKILAQLLEKMEPNHKIPLCGPVPTVNLGNIYSLWLRVLYDSTISPILYSITVFVSE